MTCRAACAVLALLALPGGRLAAQAIPDTATSLVASDSVRAGWRIYHINCFRCHGFDAMNGSAPDLRLAVRTLSMQDFVTTVINGRVTRGMPSWIGVVSPVEALEVYDYIMARSSGALGPGKPVPPPAASDSTR